MKRTDITSKKWLCNIIEDIQNDKITLDYAKGFFKEYDENYSPYIASTSSFIFRDSDRSAEDQFIASIAYFLIIREGTKKASIGKEDLFDFIISCNEQKYNDVIIGYYETIKDAEKVIEKLANIVYISDYDPNSKGATFPFKPLFSDGKYIINGFVDDLEEIKEAFK